MSIDSELNENLQVLSWKTEDCVLMLDGNLDRNTMNTFWLQRDLLLRNIELLDVKRLQRVDSSGLAMLLHIVEEKQDRNEQLHLRHVSDQLQALIELYGLQSLIPVEPAL